MAETVNLSRTYLFSRRIRLVHLAHVAGKTQTIYPWGSPLNAPEPALWHHDILRKDGTPFDSLEVKFIKEITSGI